MFYDDGFRKGPGLRFHPIPFSFIPFSYTIIKTEKRSIGSFTAVVAVAVIVELRDDNGKS